MTLHASPNHPFNLHGGYDPVSRTIVPGPQNWLTRTLAPDGQRAPYLLREPRKPWSLTV